MNPPFPTRPPRLPPHRRVPGSAASRSRPCSPTRASSVADTDPLAPKKPHFAAKAKRVIFLFMSGGPSHVDTFDPKPELTRLHGQQLPDVVRPGQDPPRRRQEQAARLEAHLPEARPVRASRCPTGSRTSAECVDDLCVLRGCYGDSVTHPESVYLMNTGSILMGRPSLGAWAAYGLGTENRNMPAFVVLPDPAAGRRAAPRRGATASCRPRTRARSSAAARRRSCTCRPRRACPPSSSGGRSTSSPRRNREHLAGRGGDSELAARIAAYELAFRMQAHAPEVVDIAEGDGRDADALRPRPQGDGRVRHRAACSPGGWSSAACGSCRSTAATPTAGTPTPTSKATTASSACRATSRSPAC